MQYPILQGPLTPVFLLASVYRKIPFASLIGFFARALPHNFQQRSVCLASSVASAYTSFIPHWLLAIHCMPPSWCLLNAASMRCKSSRGWHLMLAHACLECSVLRHHQQPEFEQGSALQRAASCPLGHPTHVRHCFCPALVKRPGVCLWCLRNLRNQRCTEVKKCCIEVGGATCTVQQCDCCAGQHYQAWDSAVDRVVTVRMLEVVFARAHSCRLFYCEVHDHQSC